jgi:hypothetical protein
MNSEITRELRLFIACFISASCQKQPVTNALAGSEMTHADVGMVREIEIKEQASEMRLTNR